MRDAYRLIRGRDWRAKNRRFEDWPCYHTELDCFSLGGQEVGIVGRVVGSA